MEQRTTNRKQALALIRHEYAIYGKETRESMRAYAENRISYEARLKAVREGLSIYEKGRMYIYLMGAIDI